MAKPLPFREKLPILSRRWLVFVLVFNYSQIIEMRLQQQLERQDFLLSPCHFLLKPPNDKKLANMHHWKHALNTLMGTG